MAENLTPRPAATVMTLRERAEGYEILMLRRNLRSDFVGGAYVFPGGGVDAADAVADEFVVGSSDEEASRRLDVPSGGRAYYVASLRELFEEAGLLVACDDAGVPVRFSDPADVRRMGAHRRAVNAGEATFFDVLASEGLRLDLRGLEYVAHWITPVGPPRRYDTRFFVTVAPEDQVATHDDDETVANRWLRPADALAAHDRGEFEMLLPTVRNLESIDGFPDAAAVLDHARSLASVPCVEPRIVERDGALVIETPGDEGIRAPDRWRSR